MILPVSQVLPFDVKTEWVREICGVKMATYIDWMKSCYFISTVGNPTLAVPCSFTLQGLPVGLQIIGRHQDDWGVLQLGHAFEQSTGLWKRKPDVVAIGEPIKPAKMVRDRETSAADVTYGSAFTPSGFRRGSVPIFCSIACDSLHLLDL